MSMKRNGDGRVVERFSKKIGSVCANNLSFFFFFTALFLFPIVYSVLHLKQADASVEISYVYCMPIR